MKNFYASLAIAIALITAGTISGYIASSGRAGELDEFFCSGLKQEKSYEKYNLEHYKILIEGRDGWIFRTENDFRKDFTVNDVTGRYLTKIQNVLERKDIELVIIYPPVRGMVHADKVKGSYRKQFALNHLDEIWSSYEKMIAGLKKSGIGIIGLDRQEVTDDFFYKRNHHWSASGANITAKKVADYVERLPIYKSLPKQTYRTLKKGPGTIGSTFEQAFRKICGNRLPEEIITEFVTMQEYHDGLSREELLEDEVKDPQVVLLGTSNCIDDTSKANFTGFLKEYLSADIDNRAVVGAGIDTSIISFFNSEKYLDGKVKVIIWEIPGYYNLNIMDDSLFRQIIPAAYGPCPEMAVRKKTVSGLVKGKMDLFDFTTGGVDHFEGKPKFLKNGSDPLLYLHLVFSDPVKRDFTLRFLYEDNEQKRQDFDRDARYSEDNDFYIAFPENYELKDLQKITLELPEMISSQSLQLEICPFPENWKTQGKKSSQKKSVSSIQSN